MRRLAVVLLLVAAAGAMAAAPAAAEELVVTESDTSAYPQVSMTVAVPPGLAGKDLPAGAFTVMERGERLTMSATRLQGDDLEIVLVIDTSGSMKGAAMDAAKAAAVSFVNGVASTTRIGVVSFGSSPGIVTPFSVDHEATKRAIQRLQARGETALYDAVRVATDLFTPTAFGRRALVLLSDGGDTASQSALDEVATKLTGARVHADVVELATAETDKASLQRLAEAGGGRVVSAADPAGLVAIYQALAATLSSQYRLSYTSAAHGETGVIVEARHEGVVATAEVHLSLPAAAPAPAPTPTAEAPAPKPKPAPAKGPSTRLLVIGAGAFFAAFLIIGVVVLAVRPRRRRSSTLLVPARGAFSRRHGSLEDVAEGLSAFIDKVLDRWGRRRSLNVLLEEAGIALRPGEFAVLTLSGAVVLLMLGLLMMGPLGGILGAVLAVLVARAILSVKTSRRRAQFADQLGDTLQLLSSSLRAGYAMLQAVDAVARDGTSPTSDEFRRLVIETRLGRDVGDSLRAMSARVGGDDFEWVVQAIEINREVGGDLAEVLDNVGKTIRERNQLRRHVKALTAEGRLSAYILVALPFVLAVALKFINPGYFADLTRKPGIALVGVAGVFMVVGSIWLKKIVKLVY